RERAFRAEGSSRHSLVELLRPFAQTAHLCGLQFLEPFWVAGTHYLDRDAIADHARRYRDRILALRDEPGAN
ncbi:MAG: NAD(P)H-dependent oxidoreductase, partial [Candidatus Competibacterales bacterium]|nr:NAD(P)H-dependent oxidoreductase [Candidatus Competibacterales bacterium]